MRLVHGDAARAAIAGRSLVLALVVLPVVLGGCFDDDSGEGSPAAGARLAAPVRLANCRDWNRGTIRERQGTIEGIREFAGAEIPGTGGRGATLPDDRAYDLFQNYCKHDFARGFKLYKLYARAAAFTDR